VPSAVTHTQSPVVPHVSISGPGVSATSVPGTGVSISGPGVSAVAEAAVRPHEQWTSS